MKKKLETKVSYLSLHIKKQSLPTNDQNNVRDKKRNTPFCNFLFLMDLPILYATLRQLCWENFHLMPCFANLNVKENWTCVTMLKLCNKRSGIICVNFTVIEKKIQHTNIMKTLKFSKMFFHISWNFYLKCISCMLLSKTDWHYFLHFAIH